MKPKWTHPNLQILTHNHPEEAVLTNCKTGTLAGATTNTNTRNGGQHCRDVFGGCPMCSTQVAS
jgi:hypothetical protein